MLIKMEATWCPNLVCIDENVDCCQIDRDFVETDYDDGWSLQAKNAKSTECHWIKELEAEGIPTYDQSVDNVDAPVLCLDRDVPESICDVKNKSFEVVDRAANPNSKSFRLMTFTASLVCFQLVTFAYFLPGANSTFVEVPKNALVYKQNYPEAIEMGCESDCQCELTWLANKHDSVKQTLYNGYILRSHAKSYCTVLPTDKPGKCHLNFTNEPDAAQTYICLEPGTLAEASAELILLVTDIICSGISTEDFVNLTCSLEFRGNWAPRMEWKELNIHGEKNLSVGVNTTTVPNERVTSTLVMPVHKGIINYTCTTKFDLSEKPNTTTATNFPDYQRSWTFSVPVINKPDDETAQKSAGIKVAIFGSAMVIIAMLSSIVCFVHAKKRLRVQFPAKW